MGGGGGVYEINKEAGILKHFGTRESFSVSAGKHCSGRDV